MEPVVIASQSGRPPGFTSSVSVVNVPSCVIQGCCCSGRGSLTFSAVGAAIHDGRHHGHNAIVSRFDSLALTLRSKLSQTTATKAVLATILHDGLPLFSMVDLAAPSFLFYDMNSLDSNAFTVLSDDPGLAVVCFHQPPAATPYEDAVNASVPSYLLSAEPETVHSPAPLLLIKRGGWALGGYLARASLLNLKRTAPRESAASVIQTVRGVA